MRLTVCTLIAAAAIAPSTLAGQSPADAARIARIEADIRPAPIVRGDRTTIAARMRALNVPAVSIAVVDSGRIVWAKAYGVADVASGQPATPDTRFQAASISKPVASMAALRLVEDGKLSLDADVNTGLRSWTIPRNEFTTATPVTLRMLLTHTAGLTVHGFPGYASGTPVPTVTEILDGTAPANTPAVRVDIAPGTAWRYSGGGMTVAQLLMTDATGEAFPDLARRLVLAPAGMTSSGYEQPLSGNARALAAAGHLGDGTVVPGQSHTYPEMMAAGLWTTASDLARWILAVQQSQTGSSGILSESMTRAMLTPGLGDWGLGVATTGAGDSSRFSHGGANRGFRGTLVGYVSGGRGVVVLTNSDAGGSLASDIVQAVGREYDWAGLREVREFVEVSIDPQLLDGYVGRYRPAPGFEIEITRTENQLSARATAQAAIPIYPESDRSFFAKVTPLELRFETDATGQATAVVVIQGGTERRAPRIE